MVRSGVRPPPGQPPEWEILLRLAGAMVGVPMPEVDVSAMDDLYVAGLVATACSTAGTPLSGRDPQEATAALIGSGRNDSWTWEFGSDRGATSSGDVPAG